jgi:hypothetical protein
MKETLIDRAKGSIYWWINSALKKFVALTPIGNGNLSGSTPW